MSPTKTYYYFCKRITPDLKKHKLVIYLGFQFYLTFIKNELICCRKKTRFGGEQEIDP